MSFLVGNPVALLNCLSGVLLLLVCFVDLPPGVVGWSALCDCGIPGHTHLLCSSQKHHSASLKSFVLLPLIIPKQHILLFTPSQLL